MSKGTKTDWVKLKLAGVIQAMQTKEAVASINLDGDTMDLPYYTFAEDSYSQSVEARFWNCGGGKQIAIVAIITKGIDWAAYIGTDAPNSYTERGTCLWAAECGCKLSEKYARYFFPEIKLGYRY